MYRDTKAVTLLIGLLVVVAAGSVMADAYLKQVTHTAAFEMMGQKVPEKNDTTVMWIGPDRAASITGDTATVVCIPGENVILMINHQTKQYSKLPMTMDELIDKAVEDKKGEGDDEAAAAKAMMKAMMAQSKASVEPTAETKKIESWQAKKYLVNFTMAMMSADMEVWATEDINIDYKLYQNVANRMFQMQGAEQLAAEMSKIKGVTVLNTTTLKMMGTPVTAETRLLEFGDKAAPAGVYAIPAGYTEVPFTGM